MQNEFFLTDFILSQRKIALEFYDLFQKRLLDSENLQKDVKKIFENEKDFQKITQFNAQQNDPKISEKDLDFLADILLPQTIQIDEFQDSQCFLIALGIESNFLKICDYFINNFSSDEYAHLRDFLYKYQAHIFNQNIPVLQNICSTLDYENQNNFAGILDSENAIFSSFLPQFSGIKNYLDEGKTIIQKMQNGTLEKKELISFLNNTNLPLLAGSILGGFCVMIATDYLQNNHTNNN